MRMRVCEEGRERRAGAAVTRVAVRRSETGIPKRHPSKERAREGGRERGKGKGLRKRTKNRKNERLSRVYERGRKKRCGKSRQHRKEKQEKTKENEQRSEGMRAAAVSCVEGPDRSQHQHKFSAGMERCENGKSGERVFK